jgi:hypothetical protein
MCSVTTTTAKLTVPAGVHVLLRTHGAQALDRPWLPLVAKPLVQWATQQLAGADGEYTECALVPVDAPAVVPCSTRDVPLAVVLFGGSARVRLRASAESVVTAVLHDGQGVLVRGLEGCPVTVETEPITRTMCAAEPALMAPMEERTARYGTSTTHLVLFR